MREIYKVVFKIKKEEFVLFIITFLYIFLKNLFFEKLSSLYFLIFLFEIYFTISIYSGIKKCVYNEDFILSFIFKDGLYYLPSILLYNLFIGFTGGIIYLIVSGLISSIKTYSIFSFFLFVLIIVWASFPLFLLLLTLYTPFIVMADDELFFDGIKKSFIFVRKNLEYLILLFFPFLILWIFFFTIFKKYDKIFILKNFLLFLIVFLEILTVKLIFLLYKGLKNGKNI